jgi:hypothetical protein
MKGRWVLGLIVVLLVAALAFAPMAEVEPGQVDWMELINTVLGVIVTFLVTKALPVGLQAGEAYFEKLKAEIEVHRWNTAKIIVENAVRTAEQLGLTEVIRDKKEYAVSLAQEWLNGAGIEMDLASIEDMIEAEVNKQFGGE